MIEPLLEAERAMTVGMLDHAERVYRSVADTDPRNSIAVVGLARVALERGQDVEALRLARRALGIDGENVAAQRLVARLEEVLTVRGVPLPPEGTAPGPAAASVSEARSVTTPGPVSQLRRASTAAPRAPGAEPPASTSAPRAPGPEPAAGASEPPAGIPEPPAGIPEPPAGIPEPPAATPEPSPPAVTPTARPKPPATTSARRDLLSRLLRRD